MRFVNPARSSAEQNLVACQNGRDIYFYTLRPLEADQELLVWYSPEFAQRLCGGGGQHQAKNKCSSADEPANESENLKQHLPQTWRRDQTKAEDEKIDVEILERDTPPDTPDDQVMDFSKKEVKEERSEEPEVIPSPRPEQRDQSHQYVSEHAPILTRNFPLHLHGLYGHREGVVGPYPVYPQTRPLQTPYPHLLPHYPRLLLPPYPPTFRYSSYPGADGLPYPPVGPPSLVPMPLPYQPSPHGGLKELTPNVSPPRGAPVTPELSPIPKAPAPTPERPVPGCEEAVNLSVTAGTKSSPGPRGGPGHKALPYPLKKQNGKIKYECNVCMKTFGQLSNLKVHLRVHSGERPFECNLCKKSFTQLAHLQKHHLVHTGEKPHECQVCHKRFSSTSNLKTHLRLHSGEKPYQCKLCNTKFTQYIHLKLHRRLHSGRDRPYRCLMCTSSFFHRFSLSLHQSSCCPASSSSPPSPNTRETVERFDASQEADTLAETATAPQVEEAVERWLARTLEGEGKEDQREATELLRVLGSLWGQSSGGSPHHVPTMGYQERASVVHLHKRPVIVKSEGQ